MSVEVKKLTPREGSKSLAVGSLVLFTLIAVAGLSWAKWLPYWTKLFAVASTRHLGTSVLTGGAASAPAASFGAGVSYLQTYFLDIWPALVVGLLLASAIEALLPHRWLLRALRREGSRVPGALVAALIAIPCMMCTCCSAPATISLRRQGVPISAALAWWIANPSLNPAVLAFMALVLPWKWVLVRIVSGAILVFLIAALGERLANGRLTASLPGLSAAPPDPATPSQGCGRFLRALGRLGLTLLPEYLVVVFLLGALRGVLFPAPGDVASWGLLAVVLFAVVGTLFVIPTAGEIPIIQGLLSAGMPVGPVATLLLTLPAISLPSIAMTARSFPIRVLLASAVLVAMMGMLIGLLARPIGLG